MNKKKLLFKSNEWTVESIEKTWKVINKIAKEDFGLDYYEPQIELITYDQMLDAYMNVGMPVFYKHWSFGKQYLMNEQSYRQGKTGLAYELVINSDPAIAYLMETNSMTMQALVMAHACCGHVHFFKNNYLFKEYTDASGIINYLKYAKNYIDFCEQKHGEGNVTAILDAAHALQNYGVDTYKRVGQKSHKEIFDAEASRLQYKQEMFKEEFDTLPGFSTEKETKAWNAIKDRLNGIIRHDKIDPDRYLWKRGFPEENILLFLEKMSPFLYDWEREVIRIVRIIAQYFYPQRQTKMMNEGFATAIHYTIMNSLYDQGYISEGNVLEFLHSHTSVCCQPKESHINVYALGFAMFQDLKRIALNPTDEDKEWFPTIAGTKDWLTLWKDCVANYRDESFVLQFLSPKVIRDLKLFTLSNDKDSKHSKDFWNVQTTHRTEDIYRIREELAKQYSLEVYRPNLQIFKVDWNAQDLWLENYGEGKKLDLDLGQDVIDLMRILWPTESGQINVVGNVT